MNEGNISVGLQESEGLEEGWKSQSKQLERGRGWEGVGEREDGKTNLTLWAPKQIEQGQEESKVWGGCNGDGYICYISLSLSFFQGHSQTEGGGMTSFGINRPTGTNGGHVYQTNTLSQSLSLMFPSPTFPPLTVSAFNMLRDVGKYDSCFQNSCELWVEGHPLFPLQPKGMYPQTHVCLLHMESREPTYICILIPYAWMTYGFDSLISGFTPVFNHSCIIPYAFIHS